jgi:nicotinamide riboside kinase
MVDKRHLVVNLFGGPGTGKSQTAYGLSYFLKLAGIDVEFVSEYAKDAVWDDSLTKLQNQIYVFGKQHHKLWRVARNVDVTVTDSPIILSAYYNESFENLTPLVLEAHNQFNTLNVFLVRVKDYNPNGRYQTEDEAKAIDPEVRALLDELGVPYIVMDADDEAPFKLLQIIDQMESHD